MSHVIIDEQMLVHYKSTLAEILPSVRPSHRLEAMAAGFGFDKYASLRGAQDRSAGAAPTAGFAEDVFWSRLKELGHDVPSIAENAIPNLFNYQTYVAVKNGFNRDVVYGLASGVGYLDEVCKIYVEALCAQRLSQDRTSVLASDTINHIIRTIPPEPLPEDPTSSLNHSALTLPMFKANPGAAAILLGMVDWKVTLEFGDFWMSTAMLDELEVGFQSSTVRIRVSNRGLQILREAQKQHDKMGSPNLGVTEPT